MEEEQLENTLTTLNDSVFDLQQSVLRIEQYLELLLGNRIKEKIKDLFTNDTEIQVYQLSDGIRTTRQIEEIVKISRSTISVLWKKWSAQGIMFIPVGNKPYKSKFSMIDLALGKHQIVITH